MQKNIKLCSGFGQWHSDRPDSPNPKPYQTITLDDILGMAATPPSVVKENAQWFIPSTLLSREAEKQRTGGSYHALWCDFDNHALTTDIQAVLAGLWCSHVIYSSRSSTLDRQKWRVIIPLATPANAGDWQRVAAIINDRFEQAGIVPDRASERVNQICYLPNRGEYYQFHIEHNPGPLNWREALADELAEKQRQADQEKLRLEQLREQSRLKAIERMATGSHSPIDAYNHSYPVMQCLELYGYKRVGKKYLSPNSTSGNAGVTTQGHRWTSSHGSDAGIGQPNKNGGGCNGDAFDLFTWYEHGGNRNAALKAAGDMFTINGKPINKANQRAYREHNSTAKTDKKFVTVSPSVPLKVKSEEVSLTLQNDNRIVRESNNPLSDIENTEGTGGTEGTTYSDAACDGSPINHVEGTEGTTPHFDAAIDPTTKLMGQTDEADTQRETDGEAIQRLAALLPLEYDRIRVNEAKTLSVRPATLDKQIAAYRKESQPDQSQDIFTVPDPWPDEINPAELLDEIAVTIRRFIVCNHETSDAAALWVAMTWFIDVVQVAPLAVITAPEKRCGKSQLLFILGRLVNRPLTSSNITAAALFRSIDLWSPTLLIDEADAFMKDNEELRGLLNCGHTRDSAYIIRTVGDAFTPTRFNVWGAKALAGIGHLAETLMDRAITLELRRKMPHENVDRLRHAESGLFDDLVSKLARFADDYRNALRAAKPRLPNALNDRAQDNWEALFAIAELAGAVWLDRTTRAALKLSGSDAENMSIGVELLADIKELFDHNRTEKISTADLITALCDDDEKPWATYNKGQKITPRQVSKRLGEYGIKSKGVRIGHHTPKGFEIEQFKDAFNRYLVDLSATPQQIININELGGADTKTLPQRGVLSATPQRGHIRNKCQKYPECVGLSATLR